MKKSLIILLTIVSLFSCENRFPNYSEKEKGVYYQLISFDESDKPFKDNKFVVADIEIIADDKVVFKHYEEQIIYPADNQLNFLFNYLNEGDSALFMVETSRIRKELPLLNATDIKSEYVKVFVKVHQYLSQLHEEEDKEMLEQILLNKYLQYHNIKTKKGPIYVQRIEEGSGEEIKNGKIITIHYKGYYVNQLEFDNTYKKMDFTFTYGTPGQVIKGLEIALKGMKKGEKSKIIIPSQFAFGEVGSTTQIIPPYTTVIYELEIVNVK